MDIYVFSDESGVFDCAHNDIYVYGGVVFFSKEERDVADRKYRHAERILRLNGKYEGIPELKATAISNQDKGSMFRSTSRYHRFGIVIDQKKLLARIFKSKKDKQRYLDFAYKIGLKRLFESLVAEGAIDADEVENLYVFVDEHTTATNGKYELREALEQEFKLGTYNLSYSSFFPPIFKNLKGVTLSFCNSAKKPLVRAADIIANRVYHVALTDRANLSKSGVYIVELPE